MTAAAVFFVSAAALPAQEIHTGLPEKFDLRNLEGHSYVSQVKGQSGGTCWAHGTMAAVEGHLMMSGVWESLVSQGKESGPEPDMAEYHLDWWNGFNTFYNEDIYPDSSGLDVHYGGDYRVAAAYFSRGDGPVRDCDGQSFYTAPSLYEDTFHRFYVRDIEWYQAGRPGQDIAFLKQKIMDQGVMATCMSYNSAFIDTNYIHCQPGFSTSDPNHSVAIVGWDDTKPTRADEPGAWLVKNSWWYTWGHGGYFWMSYYDKWAGHHPEMGAVSFINVEPMKYDNVYYHDYHGWRDTLQTVSQGFNRFVARGDEQAEAVSFFTAADSVVYEARIFKDFSDNELLQEAAEKTGFIEFSGFHTVDLDESVSLAEGDTFYVYLFLSRGGHAIDRTSFVPVLLGSSAKDQDVISAAGPGESFIKSGALWEDLYDAYIPANSQWQYTANLCVKALTTNVTQTGIAGSVQPSGFVLNQNYPNPFNPSTTISYHVPSQCRVVLSVYSTLGRKVAVLVDGIQGPGTMSAAWNGMTDDGAPVSSGVYIYQLKTGSTVITKKMILTR